MHPQLRSLITSSTGAFCCLFLFTVRASITAWPAAQTISRVYCIGAVFLSLVGIVTTMKAQRLISERSTS